ncbi:hypothetical protein ACPA9J_27085 [Pseudomonas aeruginosa]
MALAPGDTEAASAYDRSAPTCSVGHFLLGAIVRRRATPVIAFADCVEHGSIMAKSEPSTTSRQPAPFSTAPGAVLEQLSLEASHRRARLGVLRTAQRGRRPGRAALVSAPGLLRARRLPAEFIRAGVSNSRAVPRRGRISCSSCLAGRLGTRAARYPGADTFRRTTKHNSNTARRPARMVSAGAFAAASGHGSAWRRRVIAGSNSSHPMRSSRQVFRGTTMASAPAATPSR